MDKKNWLSSWLDQLEKIKLCTLIKTYFFQDETPRFPKTLANSISLFKKLKLDVLIHAVNASGLSAYNPVERRLAPLSKAGSGVVLPHDTHGSHLDSAGNTTDLDLEKRNFKTSGLGKDLFRNGWNTRFFQNLMGEDWKNLRSLKSGKFYENASLITP